MESAGPFEDAPSLADLEVGRHGEGLGQGEKERNGAGNEIRTRDPNLGKVVLYH